jgi:Flp pilus assembly protein TadG
MRTRSFPPVLQRFARARRGAVAVEFAFLALPFLFMLFAVLELALVFLLSASLDTAMEDASRQIRTGGFQGLHGAKTEDEKKVAFKGLVCRKMMWLAAGCEAGLFIDVQRWPHAGGAKWSEVNNKPEAYGPKPDTTGKLVLTDETVFNAGDAKDIVLVRGYFKWVLMTPFLSQALSNAPGGVTIVRSTQTFRNEPY